MGVELVGGPLGLIFLGGGWHPLETMSLGDTYYYHYCSFFVKFSLKHSSKCTVSTIMDVSLFFFEFDLACLLIRIFTFLEFLLTVHATFQTSTPLIFDLILNLKSTHFKQSCGS